MARLGSLLQGDTVKARSLRATLMSLIGVLGGNGLRLLSNLVLTRILFPEAFGVMALVQVFMYGLQMFSDLGINASVLQSKHGDDPKFLQTAWTLQVMRGVLLWFVSLAIAYPAATFYETPALVELIPVVALSVLISGFQPSRAMHAARHMRQGQITMIALVAQFISICVMLILAWWWRSVWALAVGAVVNALVRTLLEYRLLDGVRDRFVLERSYVKNILGFGAFIFFSTIATFAVNMGGRAILGAHVSNAMLGIVSIGLLIGTLPELVITQVARRVLLPLYRMKPPIESEENRLRLLRAQRLVTLGAVGASCVLAFAGIWLIELLYDPRYALGGAVVVLIAMSSIPAYTVIGAQSVLLASGDSRRHFYLQALLAAAIIAFTIIGVRLWGVGGVLLAPGLAQLLVYPVRSKLTHRYRAWDPVGELGLMGVGLLICGGAVWLHWAEIMMLFSL